MSKTSRTKLSVFLATGIAAVILAAALSVFYGSTKIPFETVLQALRAPDMTDQQQIIIHELRIPRTIGCILVGAAFAVAGAIMQGVTRNPLADSGLHLRSVWHFCLHSASPVWCCSPFWVQQLLW